MNAVSKGRQPADVDGTLHRTGERTESAGRVILAVGLLKNDKFEWVVQKAAELGASAIVPVQMEHCVVKLNDTRRKDRHLRWQRIAQEAAKQCGRNDIPDVTDVLSFTEVLDTYGTMPVIIPFEKETRPLRECCATVRTGTWSSVSARKAVFPMEKSPRPQ